MGLGDVSGRYHKKVSQEGVHTLEGVVVRVLKVLRNIS